MVDTGASMTTHKLSIVKMKPDTRSLSGGATVSSYYSSVAAQQVDATVRV